MSASTSDSRSREATRAALALTLAPGIGPARHRDLVALHGGPIPALLRAVPESGRREALLDEADRHLIAGAAAGLDLWCSTDARYPASLADLPDPPPVLWALGDAGAVAPPLVAIVGTRRCTAYGERVTKELARALARAGVSIVSGMARGIDAAAHEAALEAGGRTVAVLGTGADVAYPAVHRRLHAAIARGGLLLSEAPPGRGATPGAFPRRNRIIAALAPVLVVVEAGVASGALITARVALDLGRTIAAVPGPIDVPQSAGTNELLRDGAVVIAAVADALALVGATPAVVHSTPVDDPDALAVWSALADGPLDVDGLCARSRLPAARCLGAVTALELSGRVECALTGEIRRR